MEWLISIVSGLISGMLTCWFFYRLAGKELKQEAEKLRHLNILTIRALERAGLAKVSYDVDGILKGFALELQANVKAETVTSTETPVVHHDLQKQSK
jgi:hypothetical protein